MITKMTKQKFKNKKIVNLIGIIMKKNLIIFSLLLFSSTLFSSNMNYEKKNVSSVEYIWMNRNINTNIHFEKEFYDVMFKQYIMVERFEYNSLPDELVQSFKTRIVFENKFSVNNIEKIIENSVLKKINKILNSNGNLKEQNISKEEFDNLQQISYFYLPFISKITQKKDSNNLYSSKIKGGIVWFKVLKDADGKIKLKHLSTIKSSGVGLADKAETFTFGKFSKTVEAEKAAQFQAIQALLRNLGIKNKKIDEFKLTSTIIKKDNEFYANLGIKDGVHLDDGFDLVKFVTKKGQTKTKKVGFVRVCKSKNDYENKDSYSKLKQYSGPKITNDIFLQERPRIGIDMKIAGYYLMNFNIPQEFTYVEELNGNILNKNVVTAVGGSLDFSYNLASILGFSQSFLDVEFIYSQAEIEKNPLITSANASIYSFYMGYSKKMSYRRFILNYGVSFGYDMFYLSGEYSQSEDTHDYQLIYGVSGVKAKVACEFMINPDLLLNFGVGYQYGFQPYEAKLKIDDEDIWVYSNEEITDNFTDLNMNFVSVNVGISYSLSIFKYNTFGSADGRKKY